MILKSTRPLDDTYVPVQVFKPTDTTIATLYMAKYIDEHAEDGHSQYRLTFIRPGHPTHLPYIVSFPLDRYSESYHPEGTVVLDFQCDEEEEALATLLQICKHRYITPTLLMDGYGFQEVPQIDSTLEIQIAGL